MQLICWRDVPTDNTRIGQVARKCEPYMRQVFVTGDQDDINLERQVSIVSDNVSPPFAKIINYYNYMLLYNMYIVIYIFLFELLT